MIIAITIFIYLCYEFLPSLRIWNFVIVKEYFLPFESLFRKKVSKVRIKTINQYKLNAFSCGIFKNWIYTTTFVENSCTATTKACILNHEIGHVKHLHNQQSFLLTVICIFMIVYFHWSFIFVHLIIQQIHRLFSEIQADNYAIKIVGKRNYLTFLEKYPVTFNNTYIAFMEIRKKRITHGN
jgi:Zn-dependent protease with chaperone function